MPPKRKAPGRKALPTRRPFLLFSLFLLAGTALSYGNFGVLADTGILLAGILLPLTLALRRAPRFGPEFPLLEDREKVPGVVWVLVVLVALGTRFYRLTDLNSWPTRDDGYFMYQALGSSLGVSQPFFYGIGEMPPVFRGLLGTFLKFVPVSLFFLWLFPTLLSLATLPVGYWAVRRYFPRTFSLLFTLLLAGSFWPMMLGRFCNVWALLLPAECLFLGLMAGLFQAPPPRVQAWSIALGLCAGAGFYISPNHWAFLAMGVTLVLVGWVIQDRPKRRGCFFTYLFSSMLTFLPFAVQALHQHFGRHALEVWPEAGGLLGPEHLRQCAHYLSGLFWGFEDKGYNYGPVAGGFLNPLLGAFFFMGLVGLSRAGHPALLKWGGVLFWIFLLPGFLTRDLETQRTLLVIPVLLGVAVVGVLYLRTSLPEGARSWTLAGLMILSVGLDFYRLAGPWAKVLNPEDRSYSILQSEESFNAYRILEPKAEREGPGLLFLDQVSVPLDQTLFLATYPFNAADNPGLPKAHPTWMAFLTNVNYRPFLEKRFPDAQWTLLGHRLLPWDGELMLGVVSLNPGNQSIVDHWREAQPLFHGMTAGILRLSEEKSREGVTEEFLKGHPLVEGDPFLESAFWEITYFNHSSDRKFPESLADLTQILQKGYPAAHIYNELGTLLFFKGDKADARKAFLKAYQLGQEHSLAGENLRMLENQGKN